MTLLDDTLHSIQVLCKDCGKDAGWTGEHHCSNQQKPQLPTLCSNTSSYSNDSSDDDQPPDSLYTTKKLPKTSEKSIENGIWSFFRSSYVKSVDVSRILREYYQNKHQSLPEWLINDGLPALPLTRGAPLQRSQPRSRKLWEVDYRMTSREKERLALRHGNFDEQARRKSENYAQPRMKAEDRSYNLNIIRKTHTFQSTIP